jgi:secondary thiamine-phosphate synthase enzyme
MAGDPRREHRQDEEREDRADGCIRRRALINEPRHPRQPDIRTQGAIELGESSTLVAREWRGPCRIQGSVTGRSDAVPRLRRANELKCPPTRDPTRERQHDGRNEGERQQNEKEATTKPNSLHWHLLRTGYDAGFVTKHTGSADGHPPSAPRSLTAMTMKTHTNYLTFNTKRRQEIIDITESVEECRAAAEIREGMVLVSAMHISASVFVNDHEPNLWQDILDWLENDVAPWDPDRYRHNSGTGEDNAAAHLRSITIGHEVIVPVTNGRLDLGPWQRIFYGEWDGRRPKRVILKAMGD